MIELKPIPRPESDYEAIEKRLKKLFKEHLYYPLLKEMGLAKATLQNDTPHPNPLMDALYTGRVTYNEGVFSGKFNAAITRELRKLGAQFDRRSGTFRIPQSLLPIDVRNVISSSGYKFQEKIDKINKRLSDLSPQKLAKEFRCQDLFERTLWKADRSFRQNVKNITVAPQLTEAQTKEISRTWQFNMEYWIQNWTEEEIVSLRTKMKDIVYSGNRWGNAIDLIQKSYEVSANKAKFLARQETHLLVAKFNKAKYTDAGVYEYKWGCVHRPHDSSPKQHTPGNVRYYHAKLEGTIQRWDSPPVTDSTGRRNNPGEDFNCRCFARPIVRFKEEKSK